MLGSTATVAAAAAIMRDTPVLERTALWGLAAAGIFHMLFSFANASWATPGTRQLDLNFGGSPLDTRRMRRDALAAAGLDGFEAYLQQQPRSLHVVGCVEPEENGYWLSARFESLLNIRHVRPDFLTDQDRFRDFLRIAEVDVVLTPAHAQGDLRGEIVLGHLRSLEAAGLLRPIDFGEFRAYVVQADLCR